MCLGTVTKRINVEVGYKLVEVTADNVIHTPFYNYLLEIDKWSFINTVYELTIPPQVKVNGKYLSEFGAKYRDDFLNFNSNHADYISGFHLLKSLEDANRYKGCLHDYHHLYRILKCNYLGVLAEGLDFSSPATLHNNIKSIVVMGIQPLEIIKEG